MGTRKPYGPAVHLVAAVGLSGLTLLNYTYGEKIKISRAAFRLKAVSV